ncbi:hypothetical protein D3C87_1089220 [compost metagenome]
MQYHVLDGDALPPEPRLQPAKDRRGHGVLVTEPLGQLRGKQLRQRQNGTRCNIGVQRRTAATGHQHTTRQAIGIRTGGAARRHLVSQPSQVLDQNDAQRDGNRPQFPDGQRCHALIGHDEAPQCDGVDVTVGVGDKRPGNAKYARITSKRSAAQFRQLAIVARRQGVANLTDLRFDEVVVVEQPLCGGHHAAPLLQFGRTGPVGAQQDRGIVLEAALQRRDPGRPGGHGLRGRQALCMLLQPFDTKQFAPDRRFVVPWRRRRQKRDSAAKGL